MTNGSFQVQPMTDVPGTPTTASLTMFMEDDPTLPRLTTTNAILVPLLDDENSDSGPVTCQYYTVTSFCRDPRHVDLNYANQHHFDWNKANPIINTTFPMKQKPKEIIHKLSFGDENTPPLPSGSNSDISEARKRAKGIINNAISFFKKNRASSVVNLSFEPVRNLRNLRAKASSTPPELKLVSAPSSPRTSRRTEPSPSPPCVNNKRIPIPPPRNRNLSNFRSASQSRENLEFQAAPPPIGGTFIWNSPAQNQSRKSSLTEFDKELLGTQFAKKERLRLVVQGKQMELASLRRDVQFLHQQLEPLLRIEKLKRDTERLQHQCNMLTAEVDSYTDGSIPLGETSAEFYRERSQDGNPFLQTPSTPLGTGGIPGASGGSRSPVGRFPTGSHQLPNSTANRKVPPPRPPPPNSLLLRNIPWECSKCTFRNHPDLSICEQCEMIRVVPSPHPSSSESQGYGHGQSTSSSPPYYYPQARPTS